MKITILGTASGVPVSNRKSSALLVERSASALLFDAGEGVTSTLQSLGTHIDSINRIYISHTHPDHISGLPMLLQWMHLGGRKAPLYIVCDQRIHVWLLDWLRGMFLVPVDWDFPVRIVNLSFAEFTDAFGEDVVAVENSHLARVKAKDRDYGVPAACYSFIVRRNIRPLLITSDIGSIEDVAAHLPNAAAAIIDAAHVAFDDLVAVLKRSPDTRAVLTHIPPEMEPDLNTLRNILQAEIGPRAEFAGDGYCFTLPESA